MSEPRPQPKLARLDEWLPEFDRERLARLVGAEPLRRAAKRGVRPQGEPRPASASVVRASVAAAGDEPAATSVGLGREGQLACRCSCGKTARQACEHVVGLLASLAASPALRRSILQAADGTKAGADGKDGAASPASDSSESPTAAQDRGRALALLRDQRLDAEVLRRRRSTGLLDRTFAAWRRRGDLRPLGDVEFLLEVEPEDPVSVEPGPVLHLRARPVAERRLFGPDDLESRRLPAAEWRLFESLGRSSSPADRHFVARGGAATTFLDRAREAAVPLRDAKGVHAIGFAPWTLRAALRLRTPLDEEVRNHPVVSSLAEESEDEQRRIETARRRYAAERGPLSTEEFLRLAGLPTGAADDAFDGAPQVLEAAWMPIEKAADGSERAARVAPIPFAETLVFAGPRSFAFWPAGGVFAEVEAGTGPIALARLCEQPTVLVDAEDLQRLPALLREQFRGEGVSLPARAELGLPPLPVPHLALRVTGTAFSVRATLEARYGRRTITLLPDSVADLDDASRNAEAERAALDLVLGTRLRPSAPRRGRAAAADPAALELSAEGDAAVEFWVRDLPRLVRAAGPGKALDEVSVPPAMRRLAARGQVRATLAASSTAGGAIEVALRFAAEGVSADVDAIREALLAKRRWVRLDDGSVAELSDRVAELAESAQDAFAKSESTTLPRWAIGEVEAWSALADEARLDGDVAGWTKRLRALPAADPGPIEGLRAELRSYQRTGVAWLQWLADLGVGGILADDMGLGKTVQALALLAWRRERDGKAPSLVVAPTSVALNWIREAERFVPGLDALLLHGADRHERYDDVAGADLVVTTYALLRRDVERLRGISFRYVLLDEAQQIKNHAAATTAAAKSLQAGARLALTGTPIENRLLELWSILDFCNPGMLGGWRSFSRRWERPVVEAIEGADPTGAEAADEDDAGARPAARPERPPAALAREETAALRARIRPFVLRRAKSEVQRDLPPKIESDVVVEMTPAQRRAYAALAANVRADLGPKIAGGGLDRNRMLVLTALLRLRQMACDPRLVDPRMDADDSAKLLALRELVSEVVGSGRRALVFSQFVELLTLLRADLDERGIEYCYLDGRTRDRQKVIEAFTEGSQPLFLLSLRAGGTGINLAAADVVIHLDPWWNPAVEEQATDRAHRIGQVRTVSVYRLVAAGTVEEAILRLKQRKRAIAGAVMDEGLGDLPRLDADEIEELFRFGD